MAAVWNNYQQNSYHQQQQAGMNGNMGYHHNNYYNYQSFQSDFNNPHYNDPNHNPYLKSERASQIGTYSTVIPPPSFGLFDHIESFMESYNADRQASEASPSNETRSENSSPSSISGNNIVTS
ncbi:hypothetical protein M8J77_013020 [Diaphorina citri]|nr:hypothetical protein M8J77_013020 [Diaphorina citri]